MGKRIWLVLATALLAAGGWRYRVHGSKDARPSITPGAAESASRSSPLNNARGVVDRPSPAGIFRSHPTDNPVSQRQGVRARLEEHRRLFASEHELPGTREREQVQISETGFHYPLVRFVERLGRDPRSGAEIVLQSQAMVADHALVTLRRGESVRSTAERMQRAGLRVRRVIDTQTVLVEFPSSSADTLPGLLSTLQATDWVERAEPDYLVSTFASPDDPAFVDGTQWAMHNTGQASGTVDVDMNAPEAWSIRSDAAGTIVAVIDTGIRLTHEDLVDNLWRNPGESGGGRETNGVDDDGNGYTDDVHGIDAATGTALSGDRHGHGSHVAGTIGARGNNGKGVAGVAWRVQLMGLSFLNSRGVGVTSDAIVCFNYARLNGAHVANASWGGPGDSLLLRQTIESCARGGMIVVSAAGNNGVDLSQSPTYPAAFSVPGMLTVASFNRMGALSYFSNYGPVHLAAPGEEVYSTSHESDKSYRLASGTSMAAPHVTGAIALLRQHYPTETISERINRLLAGATVSSAFIERSFYACRPNLQRSLAEPSLPGVPFLDTPAEIIARIGQSQELSVSVQGSPPFTYQWRFDGSPIPNATGAQFALTNIQPANHGNYSVVVRNGAATVYSRNIPLTVIGPPTIVTAPASQELIVGNNASLSVTTSANGAPRLSYQWFFNGAAIAGANDSTLALRAVRLDSAGNYKVAITSEHGIIVSPDAVIRISPPEAPAIVSAPESQSVIADSDVTLRVTASGTPHLSYQWQKDDVDLPDAIESSLVITRVQESDAGLYQVKVSNSGGQLASPPVRLSVDYAPVAPFIVRPPVSASAFIGEAVHLSIAAKGTPTPSFQWQHNGIDIPGATAAKISFPKVSAADAGVYVVKIANSAGSFTSIPVTLTIESGVGPQRWDWRSPLPQGNDLVRVLPVTNGLVAVGRHGTVTTSPNGVAWTVRHSGTTATLRALATDGSGRLVAVGDGGAVVASDDYGVTWSPSLSGVTAGLVGVAYGNGRFVAVGFKMQAANAIPSIVLTSNDGRSWIRRSADSTNTWEDTLGNIIFADGYFLAGDQRGRIARSSDGITWTAHDTGLGDAIKAFAYGNGTLAAISWDGGIATSADGIMWTKRYQKARPAFEDVTFAQNMFVVLIDTGKVLTSPDGIMWTEKETGLGALPYPYALAHAADTFVMLGETGMARTSLDLSAWTARTGGSSSILTSVTHGPPGFVVVRGNAPYLFSSTGLLWTEHPKAAGTSMRRVAFVGNQYVAVGRGTIETSGSGRVWTSRTVQNAQALNGIAFGMGLYVAVDGSGKIFTSPDLNAWTERMAQELGFNNIAFADDRFVAVGSRGAIATSTDGVIWTFPSTPVGQNLNAVAYHHGRWVAAGDGKTLIYSNDAVNWTQLDVSATGPFRQQIQDLIAAENHFIAVGMQGLLLTSSDGLVWTERSAGTASPLLSVAAGNGSFVAVGFNQTILQCGGFTPAQRSLIPNPARQTIAVGEPATIEIESVGTLHPEYVWMKDGMAIPGAKGRALRLPSTRFEDAGTYTVMLRDGTNTISSQPAYLAVAGIDVGPPIFLPEGGSGRVRVQAPAGFNWSAGSTEPWLTGTGVSGAGAGEIRFNVARNDAGRSRRGLLVVGDRLFTINQSGLTVTTQPASRHSTPGGGITFVSAASSVPPPVFQWQRNGVDIAGATTPSLTVSNLEPVDTGIYSARIGNGIIGSDTEPAVLGLISSEKVIGFGREVRGDILHSNGNIYDQVQLEGVATAVNADATQILRVSFIDLTNDIVQVEYFGAGTVSVVLENPSGPAAPENYHQPDVTYMKGHAGIVVAGADENSHLSIFSVGKANAVNQTLFRSEVSYDGVADIAFVAILSSNGKFGGLRTGNTSYSATHGLTGIYAPGVEFHGPVYVGDINAFDAAVPVFALGSATSDTRITGGDLFQPNNQAVRVSGLAHLHFVDGSTSHAGVLPAQRNKGRLERSGTDVTSQMVVNP